MSARYLAYGLRLDCEFELPELFAAPTDGEADVQIRLERLPAPHGPGLMQQGADTFLRIRDVAYFRLRGGREIAVDPMPGVSEADVPLYLLGSVMGALCYQRGLLPLHAGAIASGGTGAVAFAGPSGIGKSTLVGHLARRGYEVLCDDTCAVSFDGADPPLAWPGLPRIKLCEDAVAQLGCDADAVVFDGLKYGLRTPQRSEPRPLTALYLLQDGSVAGGTRIDPLGGLAATKAIVANLYRSQYADAMGLQRQVFGLVTALARRVQVFRATRPRSFEAFEAAAASIESHFSALSAAGAVA